MELVSNNLKMSRTINNSAVGNCYLACTRSWGQFLAYIFAKTKNTFKIQVNIGMHHPHYLHCQVYKPRFTWEEEISLCASVRLACGHVYGTLSPCWKVQPTVTAPSVGQWAQNIGLYSKASRMQAGKGANKQHSSTDSTSVPARAPALTSSTMDCDLELAISQGNPFLSKMLLVRVLYHSQQEENQETHLAVFSPIKSLQTSL